MNAPTLLIGLGGTGSKIVKLVSSMVTEEQRSNIAFAVFDTDINELNEIKKANPFIKTIQTSTKQTVGEYLSIDAHSRDQWFPVNAIINTKTLTEGAGQVRSISRLALESVIKAGKMDPLHEAIQSLYKVEEDKVEQALRVVIVSSLAGGTGSGLILPVALYTRNYLKTHFRQSANITRGFFILPEVFFEVITGETERNNLKANAYATLRELDAFLMKGDNTLPERYKDSVRMEMPVAASESYEEYNVRPYDFCFLFDAQNADGGKLNSFNQYLQHAANCIYSQSIGPMNKRSNSSEDNTIRKLAKERGRNRYAGAGSSMLIYPIEDIKQLLALKWAQQSVSKQWLVYDERYAELRKENARKREEGLLAQDPLRSEFYARQIEADAKHDVPFAQAIYKASGRYENGVTRKSDRWVDYVGNVMRKIEQDIETGSSEINQREEDANIKISALGNDWEEYVEAFQAADLYRQLSINYVEEVSQTIAWSMFKGSKAGTDSGQEYKLETYLKNELDGSYIHPNAIRFMLVKILELLKKQKMSVDVQKNDNSDYFKSFEKDAFDDTSTDDEETINDVPDRKITLRSKLTKRPTSDQEDMKRKFRSFMGKVKEYQVVNTQSVVLGQGIEYIDALIKAFESFYSSFDSKVEMMDKQITDIYKRYSDAKGTTVRYVCASKACFDKICEKYPYQGSVISIDSKLSKKIYEDVLAYSLVKDKPNNNRFFSKLFDDGIIGYFKDAVMRDYSSNLDVDVLTALEKEADYLELYKEEDEAYTLIMQYVTKTINDTRNLSCPFIETPLGEAREPIDACAFSKEMEPDKGDDSPKAQLIRHELNNHGGVSDEDIPKNMIMFYKSFYGLRANDLSKFAPPAESATHNRNCGEYFKAYFDLIKGIHPIPHLSKEISPHIDRWWHIVTKMPDLDDDNQAKQEERINAAFFWAIICKYIYITQTGSGDRLYKLHNIKLGMDDDRLIVSNGTECDKLYEVMDAIAIYPQLVDKILEDVEIRTKYDLMEKVDIEKDGLLIKALNKLQIKDPGIGPGSVPADSIFNLPMLMKKSSSIEDYYEDGVVDMLKAIMSEIKKYMSFFCNDKELPNKVGEIILNQFEKYLASLEIEKQIDNDVYTCSLFEKTTDTVIKELNDLGLRKEAIELSDRVDELKEKNA